MSEASGRSEEYRLDAIRSREGSERAHRRIDELEKQLAEARAERDLAYQRGRLAMRERNDALVVAAENDIRALGTEAHPAVLMRLDRLVRQVRSLQPEPLPEEKP